MPGVSERDFALYAGMMTSVYQFHDLMLARLLHLASPDATVIVVSDHGFHCDAQRPALTGAENPMALDSAWHRSLGMICAAGPGLKADQRVYGASILDVTPTVLTLFGLPVGEDMDGRVMVDAFEETPGIDRVPTWEDGSEAAVKDEAFAPTDRAAVEQLVALGYLDALSVDAEANAAAVEWEAALALAKVYLSSQRPSLALPLLEASYAERPSDPRATALLAQCLYTVGRAADCAALLQEHSTAETGNPVMRAILLGSAWLALGRQEDAQAQFARAEALAPGNAEPVVLRGEGYLALSDWDAAEDTFRRALAADADHVRAHDGLAAAHLGKRRFHEAAQSALEAVGRLNFFRERIFASGSLWWGWETTPVPCKHSKPRSEWSLASATPTAGRPRSTASSATATRPPNTAGPPRRWRTKPDAPAPR